MHEFSVCRALIEQVETLARQRGARRALRIVVRIGPLSGVESALLEQAYSLCCAGTLAENAQLVIENSTVKVRCLQCGAESDVASNRLLCRACGDWRTQVLAGDELLLVSVELEKQPASSVRTEATTGSQPERSGKSFSSPSPEPQAPRPLIH